MAVLGIVLIVLVVLFGLGVSVSSTASTKLEVFGVDFGVSVPTIYFLGAVTGAALVVGLWLLKKGLGRDLRRRKEMRQLRAKVTDGVPEVSAERSDAAASTATTATTDATADERAAIEERAAEDPTETHQPH